ncbi:unnamed protein product [Chironomus riparius]|uniref:Uncharacterized protein n=1 Tax=Chironomus riparius TaxID=315576 RepID=A0A9N9RX04_9DIPT|nr:unnamed protein product [Chironomus riparius]
MVFKVFIFCGLIYQSLAGGPSFDVSSSSSSTLTLPACMTCNYVLTQLANLDELSRTDCDPGAGIKTLITLTFDQIPEIADKDGYCSRNNEPIPNSWNPLIYGFYFL